MSKKIEIDKSLICYIQKGIESAGSRLEFSKRIDVAHTTVRDWISGKSKTIRLDVLLRVIKEIKVFMSSAEYDNYMNIWGEGKIISYSATDEKLQDSDSIVLAFLRKIVPQLSLEEKNNLVEYALTLQNKKKSNRGEEK